ncbi:hypothetical protein SAMN05421747_101354 [Parapedobacter composti]|uniref:Uncharacterized protein n=1 Tax=Parapedobacter composti TaxID=623281 RepID=A0A1I1E5M3_9SPHI|nr:hypothetical protein [Parapedobacter composti]SFB82539.1 hypothetical protein SAMN05421747_101354 [Parapedobacter composti]
MQLLFAVLLSSHIIKQDTIDKDLLAFGTNKVIPSVIERQALIALSYFPELKETSIHFVFRPGLKGSVMAARPAIGSLFKKRDKRTYQILINPVFKLEHAIEPMRQIPDSVMIGWLGHELGHIMDYERKSTWSLMGFGISYGLSKKFVRKAERVADSFAVNRGMGDYLVATKAFILDHSDLPQAYKDKIAALYLSPDDIVELISDLEREDQRKQDKRVADEEEVMREVDEELKKSERKKDRS